MPGLNRRGPGGQGPMTGRMRGLCTRSVRNNEPEEINRDENNPDLEIESDFRMRNGMGRRRGGGCMQHRHRFRGRG